MRESRKARELARTRKDILEAAARAFVQGGFRAATMQEIAKEAGFTAASLYSYFSSKEEILAELRQLLIQEMRASFETPCPDELSFRQKLELLFRRQAEVATERFELVALLHAGIHAGELPMEEDIYCQREELFANFIRTHATKADIGEHTPEDVAIAVSGISLAFFSRWIRDPQADWLQAKFFVLLDLLFSGLRPRNGEEAPT